MENPFKKKVEPPESKKPDPEIARIVNEVMDEEKAKKNSEVEIVPESTEAEALLEVEKQFGPDAKNAIGEESKELEGILGQISKHPKLSMAISGTLLGLSLMSMAQEAEAGGYYGGQHGRGGPSYSETMGRSTKGAVGGVIGAIGEAVGRTILNAADGVERQRRIAEQEALQERRIARQEILRKINALEKQRNQALNNINRARNPQELKFAQEKLHVIEASIETEKSRMRQ